MNNYIIKQVPVRAILHADNATQLFDAYATETKIAQTPNHSPNEELYLTLEDQGLLDCVAAYEDTTLIGFIVTITVPVPHYEGLSTTIESQFVLDDYRKGGTGKKLLDLITAIAQDKGSSTMFMSAPIGGTLDKVAKSFGFTATNTTYSKAI